MPVKRKQVLRVEWPRIAVRLVSDEVAIDLFERSPLRHSVQIQLNESSAAILAASLMAAVEQVRRNKGGNALPQNR